MWCTLVGRGRGAGTPRARRSASPPRLHAAETASAESATVALRRARSPHGLGVATRDEIGLRRAAVGCAARRRWTGCRVRARSSRRSAPADSSASSLEPAARSFAASASSTGVRRRTSAGTASATSWGRGSKAGQGSDVGLRSGLLAQRGHRGARAQRRGRRRSTPAGERERTDSCHRLRRRRDAPAGRSSSFGREPEAPVARAFERWPASASRERSGTQPRPRSPMLAACDEGRSERASERCLPAPRRVAGHRPAVGAVDAAGRSGEVLGRV